MRKIMPNMIFAILGAICIAVVFKLNINGVSGWLLTSAGVIFIGTGIFKGNNPIKVIARILSYFF